MTKREEEDFRKYYETGDEIGRGGFGIVYKAKEKERNEDRVIKIIDKKEIRKQYFSDNLCEMTEEDMIPYIDSLKNEIKYMKIREGKNAENINTVKYYEYFNTKNEFAIIMELCDNNLICLFENKKKDEGLNIDEIYNILNQLNNCFKIMNENKIVHRDLKLENILIKYENKENKDKYIVKLTDYGISKQLLNITHLSTKIGTPKYEAPEILKGSKNYNEECDLWSLGIIIYRLCFKKFPYNGETEQAILESIKKGQKLLKKTENKELNDIIRKLLIIDPKERMSWSDYYNHSFFKKRNIKNNEINVKIKVDKEDINKDIYFLDNTNGKYWIDGKYVYHNHDNLKELNESNIELYINKKEIKYKKYFIPEKEGLYEIKLIIKSDIKDCSFMFCECNNITDIDLSSFDTKNVTNMSHMFRYCENLTNLNLSSFDTKNVTNMKNMFYNCEKITNLNLSSFDTKKVTNMSHMFRYCEKITNLNLSSFDTKNVTNMSHMFYNCEKITNLNISSFDTKNVTNMSHMFYNCEKITNLNLSSFDTKNVTNMSHMFWNCKNITNFYLSSFDTKNVTNMSHMFRYCENITNLNLSSFDTKNATNMKNMFWCCSKLKSIKIQKNMNNIINEISKNKNIEIVII